MNNPSIKLPLDVPVMLRRLRTNFLAEMTEALDAIESDLRALERTDRFGEMFERGYRKIRALEGNASIYSLPMISKICHQLEEHLNVFAVDPDLLTADMMERCQAHIALMHKVQEAARHGAEHFNDVDEALQALRSKLLGQRFCALIVEVSKVNIKLCTEIMKGYPAHVTVIDSGYQALELLLQHKYQLLIIGMEVKLLNGLALVAAVRMSARGNQDIQSILLTSSKLPSLKRTVDPNFIVARDSHFLENLARAIESSIKTLPAK